MLKKIILFSFLLIKQFSIANIYQFSTSILTPNTHLELNQEIKNIAYNLNKSLGYSKFFDTTKIVDNKWVKRELEKDQTHSEKTVQTKDKKNISFSFFNRNSDTLILIGPGFTNNKEKMVPFAHMFLEYDVAILNFRGHGHSNNFRWNPLYHLTGVDHDIQLGACEENDVFAIIENLKKEKKYKKIIGLGICFGAFAFVKAQAIAERAEVKLFDKLILDGCWLSLDATKNKILNDPYLIVSPQKGGAPSFLKRIFQNKKFINSLEWCIEKLCNIKFAHINLEKYLKRINIPTLFFYGKDDLMIKRNEFEEIWKHLKTDEKVAIITDNPHVHNHLRSKELYKLNCDLFIEQNYESFLEKISNPDKLINYLNQNIKQEYKKEFTDILKPKRINQKKNPYWPLLLIPVALYGANKLYKTYFSK